MLVGDDIPAGTYRGNIVPGSGCYWERLSGLGGTFDDIIANANSAGPEIVTIAEGDKAFNSEDCGSWQPIGAPITSNTDAPFEDGTFAVGIDIAPGTWRSAGGEGCYWERLSGFGGTFEDIIANANASGTAIVEIGQNDKGFRSSDCGTWNKIG